MIELIDHGAKINHDAMIRHQNADGDYVSRKTPLFKARTYDTVKLLMENGAKPNHRFWQGEENSQELSEITAIEHVMKYNADCAKAILDTCIEMQEDGDLIIDLSIFKEEKEKNDPKPEDEDDEMSLLSAAAEHSSMSDIGDPERYPILLHPLLQMFLSMKFKSIRFMFLSQLIFHVILVTLLTTIAINYVELTSCQIKENEENCFKNDKYGIEGCHIMNVKNKTIDQCQESMINLILQDQGDNDDYKERK